MKSANSVKTQNSISLQSTLITPFQTPDPCFFFLFERQGFPLRRNHRPLITRLDKCRIEMIDLQVPRLTILQEELPIRWIHIKKSDSNRMSKTTNHFNNREQLMTLRMMEWFKESLSA